MKKIAVFGSTGSVGKQALDVVASHADELKLVCIAARSNRELLALQAERFAPVTCILTQDDPQGLVRYAEQGDYDVLLVAVTGLHGLQPTLAALSRGKTVALANKESLVLGGEFVKKAQICGGGTLLPVDSEHAALHQCLLSRRAVSSLVLTCSGGALREYPIEKLATVTPSDVLAHPTWDMGVKITVDCATMVNKAFEVAEAHYLFDLPYEAIEVVIHPQSIVHSMVRFADGAVLAQLANPDMRLPIQYALTYPRCVPSLVKPLDFDGLSLQFSHYDPARYPLFDLGVECLSHGGQKAIAFAASDEVAVKAFVERSISFDKIYTIIADTAAHFEGAVADVGQIFEVYQQAERYAQGEVERLICC